MKTSLYDVHANSGGKIVPFANYLLPVQYSKGIAAEHMAVRQNAGLFDVSHMGQFIFEGENAESNIQRIATNNIAGMNIGDIKYSLMCYDNGGVVDDILIYRLGEEKYMFVVNASNREKDSEWVQSHLSDGVKFTDISDETALIALQGPKSEEILSKIIKNEDIPQKYYTIKENINCKNFSVSVSRTGYTGEDGFEIFTENEYAPELWNLLIENGADSGLIPCGLGARDTLRLEAGMPLYGHELSAEINPITAGLKFAVKFDKDFIGKSALENFTPDKKRIGLKVTCKGIIREQCKVYSGYTEIGTVTSGTFSPLFEYSIGMAIIDIEYANIGDTLEVDVRGRRLQAEIVKLPFYSRKK